MDGKVARKIIYTAQFHIQSTHTSAHTHMRTHTHMHTHTEGYVEAVKALNSGCKSMSSDSFQFLLCSV